jgi:hypothetical protein
LVTPSVQPGGWQTDPVHLPDTQSPSLPQGCPVAHALLSDTTHEPPQSVAVSLPFLTRSAQVGCWQTRLVQTPLEQSLACTQACPGPQALGQLPPQSASVSSLFCVLSWQVGTWQVQVMPDPVHTLLPQSLPILQGAPSGQG